MVDLETPVCWCSPSAENSFLHYTRIVDRSCSIPLSRLFHHHAIKLRKWHVTAGSHQLPLNNVNQDQKAVLNLISTCQDVPMSPTT